MAKTNLTKSADIQVTMRAMDFASRFAENWEHMRNLLGIMRPIKKNPGTKLMSKYAVISTLATPPAEGEAVSYTKAEVKEKEYASINLERYAKSVTIDAINDHGFEVACQKTDEEFLNELQLDVVGRWYAYLRTGTLTGAGATFQMALAKAQGLVRNKFKKMHKGITGVVGFCNILDVYEYLGTQTVNNVEQEFGLNYIKNFLGYNVLFLLAEDEIPQGTVIATPVENIVLYYVAPDDNDFSRAGLMYVTDGETNLIGVSIQPDYNTGESITHASALSPSLLLKLPPARTPPPRAGMRRTPITTISVPPTPSPHPARPTTLAALRLRHKLWHTASLWTSLTRWTKDIFTGRVIYTPVPVNRLNCA